MTIQAVASGQKTAQETFFRSVLSKEGKSWSEFYKYVKRRKGHRENIPTIKDCNGRSITDPIEKANSLNHYYFFVFSNRGNIPHIQWINSGEPFNIDIKVIWKRVAAIRKNKSVGPDGISAEILKQGGEAMIPYLARLLNTRVLQKVSALYFLKNLYLYYRHENNVTFQYYLPSSRYI